MPDNDTMETKPKTERHKARDPVGMRYCTYKHELRKISDAELLSQSNPMPRLRDVPNKNDVRRDKICSSHEEQIILLNTQFFEVICPNPDPVTGADYELLLRIVDLPLSKLAPHSYAELKPRHWPSICDPRRLSLCEKIGYKRDLVKPTIVDNGTVPIDSKHLPVLVIDVSEWPVFVYSYIEQVPRVDCCFTEIFNKIKKKNVKRESMTKSEPNCENGNVVDFVIDTEYADEKFQESIIDDGMQIEYSNTFTGRSEKRWRRNSASDDEIVPMKIKKPIKSRHSRPETHKSKTHRRDRQQRLKPKTVVLDCIDLSDDDKDTKDIKPKIENFNVTNDAVSKYDNYEEIQNEKGRHSVDYRIKKNLIRECVGVITIDDDDDDDDEEDDDALIVDVIRKLNVNTNQKIPIVESYSREKITPDEKCQMKNDPLSCSWDDNCNATALPQLESKFSGPTIKRHEDSSYDSGVDSHHVYQSPRWSYDLAGSQQIIKTDVILDIQDELPSRETADEQQIFNFYGSAVQASPVGYYNETQSAFLLNKECSDGTRTRKNAGYNERDKIVCDDDDDVIAAIAAVERELFEPEYAESADNEQNVVNEIYASVDDERTKNVINVATNDISAELEKTVPEQNDEIVRSRPVLDENCFDDDELSGKAVKNDCDNMLVRENSLVLADCTNIRDDDIFGRAKARILSIVDYKSCHEKIDHLSISNDVTPQAKHIAVVKWLNDNSEQFVADSSTLKTKKRKKNNEHHSDDDCCSSRSSNPTTTKKKNTIIEIENTNSIVKVSNVDFCTFSKNQITKKVLVEEKEKHVAVYSTNMTPVAAKSRNISVLVYLEFENILRCYLYPRISLNFLIRSELTLILTELMRLYQNSMNNNVFWYNRYNHCYNNSTQQTTVNIAKMISGKEVYSNDRDVSKTLKSEICFPREKNPYIIQKDKPAQKSTDFEYIRDLPRLSLKKEKYLNDNDPRLQSNFVTNHKSGDLQKDLKFKKINAAFKKTKQSQNLNITHYDSLEKEVPELEDFQNQPVNHKNFNLDVHLSSQTKIIVKKKHSSDNEYDELNKDISYKRTKLFESENEASFDENEEVDGISPNMDFYQKLDHMKDVDSNINNNESNKHSIDALSVSNHNSDYEYAPKNNYFSSVAVKNVHEYTYDSIKTNQKNLSSAMAVENGSIYDNTDNDLNEKNSTGVPTQASENINEQIHGDDIDLNKRGLSSALTTAKINEKMLDDDDTDLNKKNVSSKETSLVAKNINEQTHNDDYHDDDDYHGDGDYHDDDGYHDYDNDGNDYHDDDGNNNDNNNDNSNLSRKLNKNLTDHQKIDSFVSSEVNCIINSKKNEQVSRFVDSLQFTKENTSNMQIETSRKDDKELNSIISEEIDMACSETQNHDEDDNRSFDNMVIVLSSTPSDASEEDEDHRKQIIYMMKNSCHEENPLSDDNKFVEISDGNNENNENLINKVSDIVHEPAKKRIKMVIETIREGNEKTFRVRKNSSLNDSFHKICNDTETNGQPIDLNNTCNNQTENSSLQTNVIHGIQTTDLPTDKNDSNPVHADFETDQSNIIFNTNSVIMRELKHLKNDEKEIKISDACEKNKSLEDQQNQLSATNNLENISENFNRSEIDSNEVESLEKVVSAKDLYDSELLSVSKDTRNNEINDKEKELDVVAENVRMRTSTSNNSENLENINFNQIQSKDFENVNDPKLSENTPVKDKNHVVLDNKKDDWNKIQSAQDREDTLEGGDFDFMDIMSNHYDSDDYTGETDILKEEESIAKCSSLLDYDKEDDDIIFLGIVTSAQPSKEKINTEIKVEKHLPHLLDREPITTNGKNLNVTDECIDTSGFLLGNSSDQQCDSTTHDELNTTQSTNSLVETPNMDLDVQTILNNADILKNFNIFKSVIAPEDIKEESAEIIVPSDEEKLLQKGFEILMNDSDPDHANITTDKNCFSRTLHESIEKKLSIDVDELRAFNIVVDNTDDPVNQKNSSYELSITNNAAHSVNDADEQNITTQPKIRIRDFSTMIANPNSQPVNFNGIGSNTNQIIGVIPIIANLNPPINQSEQNSASPQTSNVIKASELFSNLFDQNSSYSNQNNQIIGCTPVINTDPRVLLINNPILVNDVLHLNKQAQSIEPDNPASHNYTIYNFPLQPYENLVLPKPCSIEKQDSNEAKKKKVGMYLNGIVTEIKRSIAYFKKYNKFLYAFINDILNYNTLTKYHFYFYSLLKSFIQCLGALTKISLNNSMEFIKIVMINTFKASPYRYVLNPAKNFYDEIITFCNFLKQKFIIDCGLYSNPYLHILENRCLNSEPHQGNGMSQSQKNTFLNQVKYYREFLGLDTNMQALKLQI